MEGFMESFIYLLITVVILVLSMRKKKQVKPLSDEETQQDHPFSELFKDEEDKEYDNMPQPAAVSVETRTGSIPWVSESEAKKMVMDADAVIREAAENNPIAQLEGQLGEDAYDLTRSVDSGIDFDLKKAVIYSEIIERKTF